MEKEAIFIDDLAKPQLNEVQRGALEWASTQTVELCPDSIQREAEQKTGLSNWGDPGFRQRLELLCDEWDSDSGLSNLGRISLRNKLLQHSTSRLLIHEQWRLHPEILDIQIERPIIVAGLPRSGTTHLLNLMAADRRLRSLPLWESYEPVPLPGEVATGDANDPRFQRCQQAWEGMQQMTPHLAAMHPMNPEHIHEELELMGPNMGSYNYEWLSHSPRWRDHYYAEDQTYQYEYMRDVLKLLVWQQRDSERARRWVLKCPQHLEQLPVLMRVFPDATVAITHRDPVAVIQSAVTMQAYGQRLNRKEVLMEQLLEYWVERVEHLLQACVRDRACVPEAQSIDVPFQKLIKDDVHWVKRIYDKAELSSTPAALAELQDFSRAHSESYGKVKYDLEGQFGVSPEALRERFGFYFEAFPEVFSPA
ncbi:sulfotransferase [Parahaliea sp. F7430]|uniref:Sulfotransferase n=1 Tax=Sediminihaliea albiluteola TaxID=2758564 RepID=A0A7W2YJU8_9GAMM|nr:sulfotransferase [Sediminihaliea albiluteola]MBA6413467.1 sulfotransferase [Sediminihaliea albiluteola]